MKIRQNKQKRYEVRQRKDKQGFLVTDNNQKGKLCHTKFDSNITSFIQEMELLIGMKKHFENMKCEGFLDE